MSNAPANEPIVPADPEFDPPYITARRAASAGIAVLPLHSPRTDPAAEPRRKGKTPNRALCRRFSVDATTDLTTIAQWWERAPDANVGLRIPIDVVVVDIDGDPNDPRLAALVLPDTAHYATGSGGRHLWYRLPNLPDGQMYAVRSGMGTMTIEAGVLAIDIKPGRNGYVVGPGSVHGLGGVYGPLVGDFTRLAAAPPWLVDRLERLASPTCKKGIPEPATSRFVVMSPDGDARWTTLPRRARAQRCDTSDGRNRRVLRLMMSMVRNGWSDEEILADFAVSPLGRKCRERGRAWTVQTLTHARAFVVAEARTDRTTDADLLLTAAVRADLSGNRLRVLAALYEPLTRQFSIIRSAHSIAEEAGLAVTTAQDNANWVALRGWIGRIPGDKMNAAEYWLPTAIPVSMTEGAARASHTVMDTGFVVLRDGVLRRHDAWRPRDMARAFAVAARLGHSPIAVGALTAGLSSHRASVFRKDVDLLLTEGVTMMTPTGIRLVGDVTSALDQVAGRRGTVGTWERQKAQRERYNKQLSDALDRHFAERQTRSHPQTNVVRMPGTEVRRYDALNVLRSSAAQRTPPRSVRNIHEEAE